MQWDALHHGAGTPVDRRTHTTENITFLQTMYAGSKNDGH